MKLTGIEPLSTWQRWLGYGDDEIRYGQSAGFYTPKDFVKGYMIRDRHIHTRGFPIITRECLKTLSGILSGHTVLDCGAGSGYLTYHLQKQGINVEGIALDKRAYGFKRTFMTKRLTKGNYLTHDLSPYSAFVISWPDYDHPAAYLLLQRLPKGALVVYQGEEYACCAEDNFFDYLESDFTLNPQQTKKLNDTHIQFYGIHDIWRVFVKN